MCRNLPGRINVQLETSLSIPGWMQLSLWNAEREHPEFSFKAEFGSLVSDLFEATTKQWPGKWCRQGAFVWGDKAIDAGPGWCGGEETEREARAVLWNLPRGFRVNVHGWRRCGISQMESFNWLEGPDWFSNQKWAPMAAGSDLWIPVLCLLNWLAFRREFICRRRRQEIIWLIDILMW